MKRITFWAFALAMTSPGPGLAQSRDTYDLSWYTIDGGGDMWSTGGSFELSGTIGQPDAGTVMTGGGFELLGGFWAGAPEDTICRGDINCDGQIDFGDINPFVLYLSNHAAWLAQYPECDPRVGDINSDGTYGQGSFGDINPFVTLLTSAPLPIPCP